MKTAELGMLLSLTIALCGCKTTGSGRKPAAASEFFGRTCAVEARFGSYAAGIDQETFAATQALLADDAGIKRVETKTWGREGEQAICIDVKRKSDAKRIYDHIKEIFDRKPTHKGPVSVFML